MTDLQSGRATQGQLAAPRVVCPDALDRVLLSVAARAVLRHDCADLNHVPVLSRYRAVPSVARRRALASAAAHQAVPAHRAGDIDAGAVADWVIGHYAPTSYPGVVLGSTHGAAVHLAAALGAPWLPTGFTTRVQWSEGAVDRPDAAMLHGARAAGRITAANAGVGVRQVHDPARRGVLAGSSITLHVRWRSLPAAYRAFLDSCTDAGAPVLLLCDTRTWPVLDVGEGHTFQVGGPVGGWEPADYTDASPLLGQLLGSLGADPANWCTDGAGLRERPAERGVEPELEQDLLGWAGAAGRPLYRVRYPAPEVFSAVVADMIRHWLRGSGKTGNRCVVDSGPLLDPCQATRAGLVPYWCESASRGAVAGAEWWLAGSERFSSVDVLPAPPGIAHTGVAGLGQWRAVAAFGALRGQLDRAAARSYPLHPLPTGHATEALRRQPYDLPGPALLRPAAAVAGLRRGGNGLGLLVC